MSRVMVALAVCAAIVGAGCGEKSEGGKPGAPDGLSLALDWQVNADHAGIYEALRHGYFADAGLDVRPEIPSDPSAPIREVAAGRVDLAISYEPEVLLAQDQGLAVKAVAALVPRPLTSLISPRSAGIKQVADLAGKTVVTAGIPYQQAYLDAILSRAGLTSADVQVENVQQSLLAPVISGRADAMLGGFLNVEGVELGLQGEDPRVVPVDRLGIPTYDELVLVASSDELKSNSRPIQLFIAALERGTAAASANPAQATQAILDAAGQSLDPKTTRAEINRTLPILAQKGTGRPFGYMAPRQWLQFAKFFADHRVIGSVPPVDSVMTDSLLPARP
jgi:putative hydroxymethylpyrimidine transport system substrate-binding protein